MSDLACSICEHWHMHPGKCGNPEGYYDTCQCRASTDRRADDE